MTRDLSVEQPACIFHVRDCPVMQSAYASLKYKNTPFELVWVVMQLTPSVVTTLASPLTLLQHINRGREVHERGLEFLHRYAGGIGTLFAHTFALEVFPLCCRAWRLSSLEKRNTVSTQSMDSQLSHSPLLHNNKNKRVSLSTFQLQHSLMF